jgi:hypothetical protein
LLTQTEQGRQLDENAIGNLEFVAEPDIPQEISIDIDILLVIGAVIFSITYSHEGTPTLSSAAGALQITRLVDDTWVTDNRLAIYRSPDGYYSQLPDREKTLR